MNRKCADVLMR